jgi:O-antigen ligase
MLYVVVVTTFDSVGAVLALAGGFVVGGACSGLLSLGSGGLLASAGTTAQRAQGGAGDPNFLASWLLSAVVLGLALAAGVDRRARALVLTGIALLVTVLLATLSRGAFVAAAVTFVLAMLLLRDYRRQLAAVAGACAVTAAVFLTAFPDALQRLLSNDRGDGRYDLWTVAWRVARSNPLHGVGLDGFTVVAVDYMRQVDPIRATYLMASNTPHVVHNTYLQLLAELGVVGLVLFAGVAFGSLACAAVAAGRAHRAGDDRAARTAHAVLLAGVGGLVSGVFLSSGLDQLLWVVLALGPALLSAPRAQQRRSATHGSRTSSLFTQSTPTPSASL